mmetsp:Transcript_24275/g.11652  ORF Transcript_24275/g.11652 Transcript_24275/m.11652 type:complete len:240 (+) Transcript_24275:308-1027(+)
MHGRLSYLRQSELMLYFFYKNLAFTLPHLYYGVICAFSGSPIYEDMYITVYNLIFTALPCLVKAVFERDLDPRDHEILKFMFPFVYYLGQDNTIFTLYTFSLFVAEGFLHGLLLFILPIYVFQASQVHTNGQTPDFYCFSITLYTACIIMVSLKISVYTRYWTAIHAVLLLVFSIALYFGLVFLYDLFVFNKAYQTAVFTFSLHSFYFTVLLIAGLFLVLDQALRKYNQIFKPSNEQIL